MLANGKAAMELQGDWETIVTPALSMITALALFVFAQRKLVGALSGALKG